VPTSDEPSFCSRLNQVGIATRQIGLTGCYHHSKHTDSAEILKKLCAEDQLLQLPSAENLSLSLRATTDGEVIRKGFLHDIAIDLILCKRAHWFLAVKATLAAETSGGRKIRFLPLGSHSFVPRSIATTKANLENELKPNGTSPNQGEEIAVIGMACRFPQADTLEEFWQLISNGATALSKIPVERFSPDTVRREPKHLDFWGNFLKSPDVFDHRFFGISGREAKSMDPQQRLALQVAYEALESSGYCSTPTKQQVFDIGCYLGVGAVDYEDNIASEDANAFSATGTLRAFISGRISHYFGWSGPSITFDTACSSSAVAIHSACKVS
jgi:Beta-ketoacyl synthase, N-terminal domain